MKRICKRLNAFFLALAIISGTVLIDGVVSNADTYQTIFSEDFEDYEKKTSGAANKNAMVAKGWDVNTNKKGNYNTGSSYEIPYDTEISAGTSNFSGASEWTNYSVEAKLSFVADASSTGESKAGISGRLTSTTHNTGYDLIVIKSSPQDAGATLQLRCDKEKLKEYSIDTVGNNTPFTLKLEFRGTMIYGYFDNEVVISHDSSTDSVKYSKGWAGIRKISASGMNVVYDDFVVSKIVPSSYPTGYLYYNDFDTDSTLEAAGIYGNKTNTIAGDVFNLGAGTYAYLREVVDALYWEDYTVEADMQIVKTASDTATKGYACIVARSTDGKNEGYEFRMVYNNGNTHLELAKRNGTTVDLGKMEVDFELNTSYKMTMTVQGNNIICLFNGIPIFDVEDPDTETYATGYAGLRSTGNTSNLPVKVDNFTVKPYQAPVITYPTGYLYCNDFESNLRLKNEGWLNDGTKQGGVYILDGSTYNYLTKVDKSATWTDYVVEADVMLNDNGTVPQYGAIAGRCTKPRSNGYELILIKENTGNTVVRLYKRGVDSGKIDDVVNKKDVIVEAGKMNNLKMVFKGQDIICYFNGQVIFEVTDNNSPYLAGYAGVISATGSAKATYDNYVVREIQPTDFPKDATYSEGYLYYNDFSTYRDLNKEGWRLDGTKKNGVYVLNGGKNNYLTNVENSKKWTDYVVEAKVVLHDDGTYPQYTAIAARSKNLASEGYELQFVREQEGTHIRLYKRGIDSGRINEIVNKINVAVAPEEEHTMKMVVQGATILCYFDGVKLFEVTDNNEPFMSGYAGIRSATGTANSSFDYFAVRQIGENDIVKDPVINKLDGDIWFYDDFKGEGSMSERGWNTDKVAIYNGSALVKTRVVIDGVKDSETWKDYEVSANVFLDKEAGIYNDNSSGVAAICARTTNSTTGYEFGIYANPTEASYLRLYSRKTGANIAVDKTTKITPGAHKLRMMCVGDMIYCYYDDKLIFNVQDTDATAGYAGMRASGYNAYYSEFTVSKARPVTIIKPPVPNSPPTGDQVANHMVLYIAAAIFSLSVMGVGVTVSYDKKRK